MCHLGKCNSTQSINDVLKSQEPPSLLTLFHSLFVLKVAFLNKPGCKNAFLAAD